MSSSSIEQKTPFPVTQGKLKGYVMSEVEAYLEIVKRTYERDATLKHPVTSSDIRRKGFSLTKKGYDPRFVDAALDRLEEVLFERERQEFREDHGLEAWEKRVAQLSKELAGRMQRERAQRFSKRNMFSTGYRISQVDAVIDQVAERLDQGLEIRVSDIRTVRFYPQRHGYDEAQVDAYLDAVVELLLSQR